LLAVNKIKTISTVVRIDFRNVRKRKQIVTKIERKIRFTSKTISCNLPWPWLVSKCFRLGQSNKTNEFCVETEPGSANVSSKIGTEFLRFPFSRVTRRKRNSIVTRRRTEIFWQLRRHNVSLDSTFVPWTSLHS
jgi:hypothetical protein